MCDKGGQCGKRYGRVGGYMAILRETTKGLKYEHIHYCIQTCVKNVSKEGDMSGQSCMIRSGFRNDPDCHGSSAFFSFFLSPSDDGDESCLISCIWPSHHHPHLRKSAVLLRIQQSPPPTPPPHLRACALYVCMMDSQWQ